MLFEYKQPDIYMQISFSHFLTIGQKGEDAFLEVNWKLYKKKAHLVGGRAA